MADSQVLLSKIIPPLLAQFEFVFEKAVSVLVTYHVIDIRIEAEGYTYRESLTAGVVISISNAGRVGVTGVLALLAGLLCELQTDHLRNLCSGIVLLPRSTKSFKPNLGPAIGTTFTVDQLLQYNSFAKTHILSRK